MKKMFFALIAVLPFLGGCWPFTKEKSQEMSEVVVPTATEEATSSEEAETARGESEAESDEK